MPPATGPLSGLRVVEISSFVAAPLGGMTLAQLGADVIRVDPRGGAADRHRWPLADTGTSIYWAGLNKGKRSVVADLRSDAGRQVVRDLVAAFPAGSGVVLTNSAGRDWLSHERLSEVCPDLIHVLIEGRSDGSSAVDYTVNAESGFPLATGDGDRPVNHVLPAWDISCGLYAALAVSSAARERERTGQGTGVRLALADIALAMAGNLGFLGEAELNGTSREPIGNHIYGTFGRDFRCSDGGRFMVVALTGRHWRDLVSLTGMSEAVSALEGALGADFSAEAERYEYREALAGLFQRWFDSRTSEQARAALAGTSLLWAPYRSFAATVDALRSPGGANPLMSTLDQPGIGPHLAPGSPMRFGGAYESAEAAPILGQHTAQVLADELGMSAERIAALRTESAVQQADDL